MRIKYTYLFFLSVFILSANTTIQEDKKIEKIKLLSTETQFEAGSSIVLKFSTSETEKPLLYCSNSYGSTLVSARLKDNTLHYAIPFNMCKKRGIVRWRLIYESATLLGDFMIISKPNVNTIETYIGPPSITAGGKDYTMLVVIPTDSLDNPLPTKTLVNAKHQFLASEERNAIFTKHLIAYKNIYSKKESGRMLVSSDSKAFNSKEFTINVTAATPDNFNISVKRPHEYADGNQVSSFFTSIIKDNFNNVISDGTYVEFFIKNNKGNILKTSGTTINGIANSKIVHPDFKDTWTVKAYINGMAESNMLTLNYKPVIENFEVTFTKNKRNISVGPLQSFMGQMIPDGLQVDLYIYKGNSLLQHKIKTSFEGYTNFNLKPAIFKNASYNIVIKTAGIEKKFNNTTLW